MNEQQNSEKKRPVSIGIPIRMSAASVPTRTDVLPPEEKVSRQGLLAGRFSFRTRRYFLRSLRWLGIFGAAIFVLDGLFWLWVLHLTPKEFQRFTACLDAGVVPSFWERFVYHIACFGGSL